MTDVTIQIGPIDAYGDGMPQKHVLETTDAMPDRVGSRKPTSWQYISYFSADTVPSDNGYHHFVAGPPEDQTLIVGVPVDPKYKETAWIVISCRGEGATATGLARVCFVLRDVMALLDFETYLHNPEVHPPATTGYANAFPTLLMAMRYIRCHLDDVCVMVQGWREDVLQLSEPLALRDGELMKVLMYGPLAQVVSHATMDFCGAARLALLVVIAAHGEALVTTRNESVFGFNGGSSADLNLAEQRLIDAERTLNWMGIDRHNCHLPSSLEAVMQYDLFVNARFARRTSDEPPAAGWHRDLVKRVRRAMSVLQNPSAERYSHVHAVPPPAASSALLVKVMDQHLLLCVASIAAEPERVSVDATGPTRDPAALIHAVLCDVQSHTADDQPKPDDELKREKDALRDANAAACRAYFESEGGFATQKANLELVDKGLVSTGLRMSMSVGDLCGGSLLAFVIVDRTCSIAAASESERSSFSERTRFIPQSKVITWSAVNLNTGGPSDFAPRRREVFDSFFRRCIWRAIELVSGDRYVEGCLESASALFHFGRYRIEQRQTKQGSSKDGGVKPLDVRLSPLPEELLMRPHAQRTLGDSAAPAAAAAGGAGAGAQVAPVAASTALYVEVYTLFAVDEPTQVEGNVRTAEDNVAKLLKLYFECARA